LNIWKSKNALQSYVALPIPYVRLYLQYHQISNNAASDVPQLQHKQDLLGYQSNVWLNN